MSAPRKIRFAAILATSLLAGATGTGTALAVTPPGAFSPSPPRRHQPRVGVEPAPPQAALPVEETAPPAAAPRATPPPAPLAAPASNAVPAINALPVSNGVAAAPAPTAAAAWGENYFGQLGTLYRDRNEASPVGVEGLTNITQVSLGSSFDLALLGDGTVASWGGNGHGQLGDDEQRPNWEDGTAHVTVQEESPATHQVIGGLHGVKAIAAANEHSLALMQDGTVMAWGNNEYGQLGDGQQGFERVLNINERVPKAVPGLAGIRAVAAGGGADYAITSAGTVMAWGADTAGQLGLGEPGPDHCETEVTHYPGFERCSERPLPVMLPNPATGRQEPLSEVEAVYAGEFAAYALLRDGHIVSWGGNHDGELGSGVAPWQAGESPVGEVRRANGEPVSGVVEVAAGYQTTLARLEDGEVLGWGNAAHNALAGAPSENCRREVAPKREKPPATESAPAGEPRPCLKYAVRIPALEALHPQALAAGNAYGMAISGGAVYTWGSNRLGQLGLGRTPTGRGNPEAIAGEVGQPTPVRVEGIGPVTGIAAGTTHAVVLMRAGTAPPAPLVTVTPGDLTLGIGWRAETSNGREALVGERLLYRVFGHRGEVEPAEQGSSENEEGAPGSLASEPPHLALDGEPLGGRAVIEGDHLTAEPGGWSGARPITFSYQWQRCVATGGACLDIAGATRPGYQSTAQDAGSLLRVLVTANGAVAPAGMASSQATEPVTAAQEGERDRASATSVHLEAQSSHFVIETTAERIQSVTNRRRPLELVQPLQALPYEVRFNASGMARVMVLTPLAAGQ